MINDLAILELEEPVEMSDSIKPACIANYNNIKIDTDTGSVVTSGWGYTEELCGPGSNCTSPNILQGTEMFLLSRPICNSHMNEAGGTNLTYVTDAMICANDHSRVCFGDSGGSNFSNVCPIVVGLRLAH